MISTRRKLTLVDFKSRVARVDPRFARMGHAAYARDGTVKRPIGMTLLGFGWIYMVASVANRRDHIELSLKQGSLDAQYHDWILMGLAVMLAASVVLLGLHLLRWMTRSGGKKSNSGGVLIGALGALVLFYTPGTVWQQGFGMLDNHSQGALMAAGDVMRNTLPGLDLQSVSFVASNGR